MMSDNRHSELIDHIRQSLKEHEEPYATGAWKSFRQHQKSRKSGISTRKVALSIAASLLFLISLFFVVENRNPSISDPPSAAYEQPTMNELPLVQGNREREEKSPPGQSEPAVHSQPKGVAKDAPAISVSDQPGDEPLAAITPYSLPVHIEWIRELDPFLINAESPSGSGGMQSAVSGTGGDNHFETGLVQRNAPLSNRILERRVQGRQDRNVRFGLTYTPLINGNDNNTDWSMGGGFYTEWAFARDFALSSGVLLAQNQLEFKQGHKSGTGARGQVSSTYLQVDLLSMEIPLSLQYALTDNFSVSAGISTAAYLKEQYAYTYKIQREIQVMTFEEGSGYESVTTTVTFTESEQQSETSFNAIDWAGFYTFSVSYKYNLSGKHTLALEPFMKMPSGRLTSRDLKYYTGGLQVKFSF